MSNTKIYGIKNCDTMKKALKWLDENQIEYTFHDYKKHGAERSVLEQAFQQHGWEEVINRRGTTWRKLPDDIKNNLDREAAIELALEKTSIIKRPLVVVDNEIYLGFKEEDFSRIFGA